MTNISGLPGSTQSEANNRAIPLLLVAPICSILLAAVLYLLLSPLIPGRIAIHVGPDGVGYGSSLLMIAVPCVIAAMVFAVGRATTREFFKNDHWFQTQKTIAVGIMALGYGVIGVALGTILSTVGVDQNAVSNDSVGMGLLGFLLLFSVAACAYAAIFPRAKMEPLG